MAMLELRDLLSELHVWTSTRCCADTGLGEHDKQTPLSSHRRELHLPRPTWLCHGHELVLQDGGRGT
eukprot:82486-Amphidinium_carterae.1